MALIVEDGTGVLLAESYASVEQANTYHAAHGNRAWAAASLDDREIALRRGTRYIETTYGSRYPGQPTGGSSQVLGWPRQYVVIGSQNWPANQLPGPLVAATCEAALRELVPGALTPDVVPGERVKQETVGPITTVYAVSDVRNAVNDSKPVVTIIDQLMEPILLNSGSMTRFLMRG